MEREKLVNQLLDNLTAPEGLSKDEAWKRLNDRIQMSKSKEAVVIPMWKKWAPVASIVAASLVVVLWFGLRDNTVEVYSDNNQLETILPDGSKVLLNKNSTIRYDEGSWEEKREVVLNGEAYFEVEEGSKFSVISDEGTVSVLGTSFNIYDRNYGYEVSCFTGKVKVEVENNDVILTPGQSAEQNQDSTLEAFQSKVQVPDWKENKFVFDETHISRVLEEIENEFGVTIDYNNDSDLIFTGTWKISTLEHSLEVVCSSFDLQYDIEGEKVYIKM